MSRPSPRASAATPDQVRAFYLDIAQWARTNPPAGVRGRCPARSAASDTGAEEEIATQVPDGPADPRTAPRPARPRRRRRPRAPGAAARLDAARAAAPGEQFTAGGQTLRRARTGQPSRRTWAEDPGTGKRRDLTREEDRAFWAWAAIEVLRHTGIRIEELTELSHHSLVQYRLPATGELVPLLQVAPSKTDTERLLVIGPELADVLSAIIPRVRGSDGAVPLVAAYDTTSASGTRRCRCCSSADRRGAPAHPRRGIRDLLHVALAASGITGTDGKPLDLQPHDFRRIFITDAVLNGMPPHIAQLIAGHEDINTTMGYKAVYPEEAINGHRAFIARRRELRPSEEYRSPTDAEWEEFLGHFERRRVALGDCGRAYSTSCIHEHSCIRCPLLRIPPCPAAPPGGIRDNLLARIAEAQREGWTGEAEGLRSASPPRTTNSPRPTRPPPAAPGSRPQHSRLPRHRRRHHTAPGDRHDR